MVIGNYPQSIVKSQFLISPKLAQSLHLPFVLHAYVLFVKDGTHINMSETNCYLPPVPKQKQYHGKIIIPWNWLKSGLKKTTWQENLSEVISVIIQQLREGMFVRTSKNSYLLVPLVRLLQGFLHQVPKKEVHIVKFMGCCISSTTA